MTIPGDTQFDIIVIGGGHAGAEAAWAAANLGARTALVTLDPSKIGVMSCNPAIGGLGKGQLVREVDALGGLMGLATDATGIMFKMLNTSKGPAVRGPRAQCDKHAYARKVQQLLGARPQITIIAGTVEDLLVETNGPGATPRITGVVVSNPQSPYPGPFRLLAPAVVLTTGTFMRGLMHCGESKTHGGRIGEAPAVGISAALRALGFELGRLKTGTPPRLKRSTIDWDSLEPQFGDTPPTAFSDLSSLDASMPRCPDAFPSLPQVDCRITSTNTAIHDLIRANLHRAPMYSGQIESTGPRYCPSIEDKVVRFAERQSHHVFLEPESHESDWIYCNGISTSLPRDVQHAIVRAMPGCARAEILQYGYAVEYDMVRPHQIDAAGHTKLVRGLFLAGQINGTSGYEEAAAQGLIAGINAVRFSRGQPPFILSRDQAYIGVLMDDLVTRTPVEPYRMFTSRAEHRLILRADNSADRLTPLGREIGVVDDRRWSFFEQRRDALARLNLLIDGARIGAEPLSHRLKRPGYSTADLRRDLGDALASSSSLDASMLGCLDALLTTILADRQYDGYIRRQRAEIKRHAEMEHRRIPSNLRYEAIQGLRTEARLALSRFRPATFGQASRLEGMSPADLTLLIVAAARASAAAGS